MMQLEYTPTRKRGALLAAVLAAACTGTAGAADDAASLAAGYKALFTCSATFLAERSPEQIARNQLTGIYGDYEAALARLPAAHIDRSRGTASVAYADHMPPRTARFRAPLGCTLLPPGADAEMPLPAAAVPEPPGGAGRQWPAGDRTPSEPAGADPNGAPIERSVARAFDGASYGPGTRTSAVVIAAGDALVAEAYAEDSGMHVPQRTWSVAKTITATLIGIAVREGLLEVQEPAALPQWSAPADPRGRIRVAHLMHMASGLDAGPVGSRTDEVYFGGGRVIDHAFTNELAALPGTRWFYANYDTLALSYLLRTRIADDAAYLSWPFRKLLHPIGMHHTTPETDWDGTFILSSQVWSTARDLARLGILLAHNGRWNGEPLLPEGWAAQMATAAPVQPPRSAADGRVLPGYGGQVWLFGARHGLPEDSFAAMGNRGQYIMVVPSRRTVIVRRGFDPEGARFRIDRFSADVLASLD